MNDSITQHPQPETKTKLIQLTQGKFAIVDAADYAWLNQWRWHARKNRNTFYAGRASPGVNGKRTIIRMHRVIAGNGVDCVDHIDGDGLNNQRHNLRLATSQQNRFNQGLRSDSTSGLKGVSWHKRYKKWEAKITANGKQQHLGSFGTAEEAAQAYDQAARELFGEFARLNFEVVN